MRASPLTTTSIPLIDLQAQYRTIKGEIDYAIHTVLERGQFILGPEVEALERDVAASCGVNHAVAVASGTDALELALRACGVGPGDEVITTAYSFVATAEAIVAVGATPVFVDIELDSYTLDSTRLTAALTARTKAIIPVHLYGHPCAMDQIMDLARPRGIRVIEDCAQAFGAIFRGSPVGGLGDIGCFSFYPSKPLGAYGDGGMVVTDDDALASQVRLLRTHGTRGRYHHIALGTNSRLDELQAAILRVKLRHVEAWTHARREHAKRYTELLCRERIEGLILPHERPNCSHVYHLFTIRLDQRDEVQRTLTEQGIETQIAYPSILPTQPALQPWRRALETFPHADTAAQEVLSLPLYPELTAPLIETVVRAVARAAALPSTLHAKTS